MLALRPLYAANTDFGSSLHPPLLQQLLPLGMSDSTSSMSSPLETPVIPPAGISMDPHTIPTSIPNPSSMPSTASSAELLLKPGSLSSTWTLIPTVHIQLLCPAFSILMPTLTLYNAISSSLSGWAWMSRPPLGTPFIKSKSG